MGQNKCTHANTRQLIPWCGFSSEQLPSIGIKTQESKCMFKSHHKAKDKIII